MNEIVVSTKRSLSYGFVFIISIFIASISYYLTINFTLQNTIMNISHKQLSFINITYQEEIRCIVLVQKQIGRLGNRMFIVASAYGLARLHSCHLYIASNIIQEMKPIFVFNFSSLLLPSLVFHSIINKSSTLNKTIMYVGCRYLPELTRSNAIKPGMIYELYGYWQSYLHFENYADELRKNIFVATQSILTKVSKFFTVIYEKKFKTKPQFSLDNHHSFKKQLSQLNLTTWIGMHVRRSDFISISYSSNDNYLFFAIKYYTSLYSNAYFLVASDDKLYCKKLFRNQPNVIIIPRSFSPGDDLITLTFCQHSIITGGTFGWWSAYLAHGRVIHDTVYQSGCKQREHYYPPWFIMNDSFQAH